MGASAGWPRVLNEHRWRYKDRVGRAIWLKLDPGFLCIYCNQPVHGLSTSGPAICSHCAIGSFLGPNGVREKYGFASQILAERNAEGRLLAIPYDPAWNRYEKYFQDTQWIRLHCACVGAGKASGQ